MSGRIKVLVVGQTPPPYHGQAIMIERLLRGQFAHVQLFHVRMAFSDTVSNVGRFKLGKVVHLLAVIVRIIYSRLVHGTKVLYYPPAGANRVPVYRDLAILLCTRWLFRRVIFHVHATGISELYPQLGRVEQFLFRRALFHPDAIVRITRCGVNDNRLLQARREWIVPNGVDDEFSRLECNGARAAVRNVPALATQELALSGAKAAHQIELGEANSIDSTATVICTFEPLHILFVGILRESKGLLVLLEACGFLAARGVPLEMEIAGQFQSAEFEHQVKSQIAELGLERQIRFLGVVQGEAKWEAYARANVLCLPTHYEAETFPTVLLEAMSFAVPVVASRWRGIPDIVDDGVTGFLVEPHDAQAVADRLEQLQADPQLRSRMGAAARTKFLEQFTTQRYWNRMEEVFVETASM
jgi:glycosyltransferase involved in cell wall biosynthesis